MVHLKGFCTNLMFSFAMYIYSYYANPEIGRHLFIGTAPLKGFSFRDSDSLVLWNAIISIDPGMTLLRLSTFQTFIFLT